MNGSEYVKKADLQDFMTDMKQFISVELSVITHTMDQRFAEQDAKFEAVNEKLDEILNAVGEDLQRNSARVDDHESRISRLEHKAV